MLQCGDDLLAFGVAVLDDELVVRRLRLLVLGLFALLPTAVGFPREIVEEVVGLLGVALLLLSRLGMSQSVAAFTRSGKYCIPNRQQRLFSEPLRQWRSHCIPDLAAAGFMVSQKAEAIENSTQFSSNAPLAGPQDHWVMHQLSQRSKPYSTVSQESP